MRSQQTIRHRNICTQTPFLNLGWLAVAAFVVVVTACSQPEPVVPSRYAGSDRLFETIEANIAVSNTLERVVEIDHSRLGAEAGSIMAPARVLIFSDPASRQSC